MAYSFRIEQAIRAASVLHQGQIRKGPTAFPYITHLFAVAMIIADYTDDEDILIAALLHDTLEDTDYTKEELQDDFGGAVKDIVVALSEPKTLEDGPRDWKSRKKAYLKQLSNAPQGTLMISAADKIHNMRSAVEEYYDNHSQFMADFSGSLDDRIVMYQEVSNILNRRLQSEILAEFNHVFSEYKNFLEHVQKTREV
jgi:(p)ppGpp synthase/HD superfamily hydrolase